MIGAPCPLLAPFAGSTQSLGRSLSQLDLVPAERLPALIGAGWLRSGSRSTIFQPAISNTAQGTTNLQKTIQYPEARPGFVQ